jgi:NADPH:quinone reductase-like Zn-dependent oxidoreductase
VANDYLKEELMRAIRLEAFGDPSVLKVAKVPVPTADEKAALVRVVAARSIRATSRMSPER